RATYTDGGSAVDVHIIIINDRCMKLVMCALITADDTVAVLLQGRMVRDKRLLTILETISREAAAVAKAEGAAVDAEELLHRTVLIAKRTAANRGRMLQDLDRHRRSEIDAIAGRIIRAAARHKLPFLV